MSHLIQWALQWALQRALPWAPWWVAQNIVDTVYEGCSIFLALFGFFGEASHFLSESISFFFKRRAIRSLSSQLVSNKPCVLSNCAKKVHF
jgi:hypothetical protein